MFATFLMIRSQFLKGLIHGIESFAFCAGRVTGFINDVVENVNDLVIAHERAAIGFGVQLQKILGLNRSPLAATSETQNLCAVFSAGGALAIHRDRGCRGVHGQMLAGQEAAMPSWV